MPLTKETDWEWLLSEAARQWSAGNDAGVRAFYKRRRAEMPIDVRDSFGELLAGDPVAKPKHRPRRPAKDGPLTITSDNFASVDSDVSRYRKALQSQAREVSARELLARLMQAHAENDNELLREHGLHNKTKKAFPQLAREQVERLYGVHLK